MSEQTEIYDVLAEAVFRRGLGPACEHLRREEFENEELAEHVDRVRRAYKEFCACEREMYNFLYANLENWQS